jgi:hypothetical protein
MQTETLGLVLRDFGGELPQIFNGNKSVFLVFFTTTNKHTHTFVKSKYVTKFLVF